jgi:hypothetical protein
MRGAQLLSLAKSDRLRAALYREAAGRFSRIGQPSSRG